MAQKKGKRRYFVSGFVFIAKALEKYHSKAFDFVYEWAPMGILEVPKNYLMIKNKIRKNELQDYDVVHLGNWETILAYKKTRKSQVFIAHAHGFFPGINYDATIRELPFVKRQLAKLQKILIDRRMRDRMTTADLFYVSTPNMLEHAKKIRKDAIWLPNPIDMSNFNPKGEKSRLEGNPSVFFPTRFHAFKNPLYGVNLFNRILEKHPGAKLHIINYGSGADPLLDEFKRKLLRKGSYVEHKKMPKEELVKLYRGADIVLGQFNENLGNLSLVELEAMAAGAPIVTLDKYELDMPLEKCEEVAFKIISDKKYRDRYIRRNYEYVDAVHSEKAVADVQIENLKKFLISGK